MSAKNIIRIESGIVTLTNQSVESSFSTKIDKVSNAINDSKFNGVFIISEVRKSRPADEVENMIEAVYQSQGEALMVPVDGQRNNDSMAQVREKR